MLTCRRVVASKLGPRLRQGFLRARGLSEAVQAELQQPFAAESSSSTASSQGFRESSTKVSSLLSQWVAPGTAVYVNPICSQLDQLLLKCEDTEAVLALLVTHRGVFFVHNLVTAIQVLGALAQDAQDHITVNRLLRDPRYDVLIRDLMRFVPKLDFLAMTNVACSLQQLDHKYYLLFSRMLRPLLQQNVPDVSTMLRCIEAYSWAGYHEQHNFYAHFAGILAESAPTLEQEQLVQACILLGGAAQYQDAFFRAAGQRLWEQRALEGLTAHQASLVAVAFTAHLRPCHDDLLSGIAALVEHQAMDMAPSDIVRCLVAFRRAALSFPASVRAGLEACSVPLHRAWLLRQRAEGLSVAEVSALLECAAYFGIGTDLTQVALDYLDDRVDEVSERASIQLVYAMSVTGAVATHSRLLLYLFRKIGAGTAWEAHRMRVFHLWICQLLQFPWLDARLKRRCIEAGLRAWCLHRRGFGSPYPDEVRDVSAELTAMGVRHQTFVPVTETPYEVDVAVGDRKDALLVVSETSRNSLEPVGGTLLQIKHLQDRGWRCLVIPRKAWRSLLPGPPGCGARASYLQSLLASFRQHPAQRISARATCIAEELH